MRTVLGTRGGSVVGVIAVAAVALMCFAAGETRPSGALPPPRLKGDPSLEEVLAARRSVRRFAPTPLTAEQIGQLCWSAQGVSDKATGRRTCPSAGALYPLELYVATAEGVRHYVPAAHALEEHLAGDVRTALAAAALRQRSVAQAPAVFIITAVVSRVGGKYGDRATRYVDMEAGHAGQNLLLEAVALGLGAVPVGAFEDAKVTEVLKLPTDQAPLYLIPVGKPSP
jgi:SagB-type dehydrogenase family enzyme